MLTDPRRKRLLYRATHRGTKEADVIIGGYFTEIVADLPDDKISAAEELLDLSDLDLTDWLTGRKPVPDRWQGSMLDAVMAWDENRRKRT